MSDVKYKINITGFFGCTIWLLGIIAFVFVLTHISQIWHDLTKLVGN